MQEIKRTEEIGSCQRVQKIPTEVGGYPRNYHCQYQIQKYKDTDIPKCQKKLEDIKKYNKNPRR